MLETLRMLSRHINREKGHFIGSNVNDKTTTVTSISIKIQVTMLTAMEKTEQEFN